MPLPEDVGHGTVTGHLVTAVNFTTSPGVGTVTFTPNLLRTTHGSHLVILIKPVVVTLDANGAFTARLLATDDVQLSPIPWTYTVSFSVQGVVIPNFVMAVPEGTTTDISEILVLA